MKDQRSNWEYHKREYSENHAPNGVSIAEYAALNGLNKNTARRYLRASDQSGDHQRDHTRDHTRDQSGDHTKNITPRKTSSGKNALKSKASKVSKNGSNGNGSAAARGRSGKGEKTENESVGLVAPARTNLKRPRLAVPKSAMARVKKTGAQPKNSNAITHAGYAVGTNETWDTALDIPDNEVAFWNVRGAMVSLLHIASSREAVRGLYSVDEVVSRDADSEGAPPPEVQLLKAACSGVDLEVMLRGFIQKQQQYDIQNAFRREELDIKHEERSRKQVIAQQVQDILARRDNDGLTAMYACRLIERVGGVAPATLLREFEHELKTQKLDTGLGSSIEDFEADVAAYREKQDSASDAVERRRKQVLTLANDMGCGDQQGSNASMLSVAFTEDDDDGEEWESEEDAATYTDMGIDPDIDSDDDDAEEEGDFF